MTTGNISESVRTIACLHSSGGSGRQWNALRQHVGDRFNVLTPNLIGYGDSRFRFGESLLLEDEVTAIVHHIRGAGGKAHLVGHSYGGAVATHVALSHPDMVASLTVYEPVLFSLLHGSDSTSISTGEIYRTADSIASQLDTIYGRWQGARDFINYWSGHDAWSQFANRQRARLASLMPKVAAEFHALMGAGTTVGALARLQMPVRLFCGSTTRNPVRHIVDVFAEHAPGVELQLLDGLGHMAPVTHPDVVNPLIVSHIIDERSAREAAVA
jgi:pimeloyl-ACP methyl ester carboxylesterase